MCTLSWKRESAERLELWFNRDELKSRPVAEAPSRWQKKGTRFLSPRDPQGGGTWMLVNEYRVVICLLNRWELESQTIPSPRSRGLLVRGLSTAGRLDEIPEKLVGLEHYRPFTLAVFTPGGDRCFAWDGVELRNGPLPPFLTSSSYRYEDVHRARSGRFEELGPGSPFHTTCEETPSPFTVRMNRPDAQTWSRSHLQLREKARWRYLAEQPDLAGPPKETVTELVLSQVPKEG